MNSEAGLPSRVIPSLAVVLAEPSLQRALRNMVRRRVPAAEADDIVQATLCDALASRAPADPGEVSRWVTAIARNKIADHFRRARREERVDFVPAVAVHEPHDERDLLRAIAEQARTPGNLRILSWVVREASGELLADIADEEQLPSAVVRQRVSRWRKRLRSTLLLLAATLGVSLAALLAVRTLSTDERGDDAVSAPTRTAGTWRIVDATIPEGADPRLRDLASKLASGWLSSSRLVVDGDRARFQAWSFRVERAFALHPAARDATLQYGTLTTFDGMQVPLELRFEKDGTVTVSGGGARFKLVR